MGWTSYGEGCDGMEMPGGVPARRDTAPATPAVAPPPTDWSAVLFRAVRDSNRDATVEFYLDWFGRRGLLPQMMATLQDRGWAALTDPDQVRAALEYVWRETVANW